MWLPLNEFIKLFNSLLHTHAECPLLTVTVALCSHNCLVSAAYIYNFFFYINQRKILYVGLSAITTDTGPVTYVCRFQLLIHAITRLFFSKRYGYWKHVKSSKSTTCWFKMRVWNNDMQYLILSKNCSEKQFWPLHNGLCQQTEWITLSLWPRASVHMAGFDLLFVFIQKLIESEGNCLEVAERMVNTKVLAVFFLK